MADSRRPPRRDVPLDEIIRRVDNGLIGEPKSPDRWSRLIVLALAGTGRLSGRLGGALLAVAGAVSFAYFVWWDATIQPTLRATSAFDAFTVPGEVLSALIPLAVFVLGVAAFRGRRGAQVLGAIICILLGALMLAVQVLIALAALFTGFLLTRAALRHES